MENLKHLLTVYALAGEFTIMEKGRKKKEESLNVYQQGNG